MELLSVGIDPDLMEFIADYVSAIKCAINL